MVDSRFAIKSDPQMDKLDREDIRAMLHRAAAQSPNVRQLGKLVDEVISTMIVTNLLSDARQSPDAV
jgi:ATP-dependent Clp protease ATP-binding subunit ClpA